MRPIDADALGEDLRDSYNELRKIYERLTYAEDRVMCEVELSTLLEVLMRIKKAPTLDVAPVVHGGWKDQDYTFTRFTCTACGSINHKECTNYCPNCGAKMDEEGQR